MSPKEFEKVYERLREGAVKRAMAVANISRAAAEDAVQNAAIYCLENLERFERITDSYFFQLVINRGRHIAESENARAANRERSVGDWFDLARVEADDNEDRLGHIPPARGAE